ncbi:MAG: helix-turn-helix transcriptional regulator [Oceanospirillaceae bacterium]|nr:helix-turn-helix transcriptional regulator [Oceanospirillaceae bacterium]
MYELNLDDELAIKLKQLRITKGYSLTELAQLSTISRASISRIENAEVSPTTQVLAKLCDALGTSMSSLLAMFESNDASLIKYAQQIQWQDQHTGFTRRSVSPPNANFKAEVIRCHLKVGAEITYEHASSVACEHHLVMLEGSLELVIENECYVLNAGDCLRYQLNSGSQFKANGTIDAQYLIVLVR